MTAPRKPSPEPAGTDGTRRPVQRCCINSSCGDGRRRGAGLHRRLCGVRRPGPTAPAIIGSAPGGSPSGRAGLRPERLHLHPEHAAEPDPGHRRLDRQPAGRQPVRHPALRAAVRAGHLRLRRRPAVLPGRLLHQRGRPRRLAGRRGHQRRGRLVQPVRRQRQLHRAGELLAVAVQPDHQLPCAAAGRPVRADGRVLGDVPGLPGAAGGRQRVHLAGGLLHARRASPAAASSPTRSSPAAPC